MASPQPGHRTNLGHASAPHYLGFSAQRLTLGPTSFADRTIYVSHAVPLDKLYSVVIHEWSHMKSTDVYGGDLVTAFGRFRSVFGGSSADGVEVVADCMAILRGASWTYYTSCNNSAWRVAANKLLNGQKI